MKKRATGRSRSYEKCKEEYKGKVCGENARGKVIEKSEFIEEGQRFQIFLSLFFSEIERNFIDISNTNINLQLGYYILEFQENMFSWASRAQRHI